MVRPRAGCGLGINSQSKKIKVGPVLETANFKLLALLGEEVEAFRSILRSPVQDGFLANLAASHYLKLAHFSVPR